MFFKYLFSNLGQYFGIWFVLTIINQVVFFGACLQPYCILASIPHVSLISLGVMYLSYKASLSTYDESTGLNEYGYAEDGYNKDGYNIKGYHRNGYNKEGYHENGYNRNGYDEYGYDRDGFNPQGLDKDNKDRKEKGRLGRFFAGQEYKEDAEKLNKEAIMANKKTQKYGLSEKVAKKPTIADKISEALEPTLFDKASMWIMIIGAGGFLIWVNFFN